MDLEVTRVVRATNFAAVKHSDQRRKNKDKSPYINHPIEVMSILSEAGVKDPDVLMGAVLHDTVEDTDTTYEEITALFGEKVTLIVRECSDDKNLGKIERKKHQIEHSRVISDEGKLVKLADKLSNCRGMVTDAPASWGPERRIGYAYWSYAVCAQMFGLNIYLDEQLKATFIELGLPPVINDLEQRLQAYYLSLAGKND